MSGGTLSQWGGASGRTIGFVMLLVSTASSAPAFMQGSGEPDLKEDSIGTRLEVRTSLGIEGVLIDLEPGDADQAIPAVTAPVATRILREGSIETGIESELGQSDASLLSPRLRMSVGRSSSLLDGGIAADRGVNSDPLRGYASAQGNLDLYDLSVRWAAFNPGPIELSLMGGVRAIQSVGGMWRTEPTQTSTLDNAGVIETYDQNRSLVTLPVVGGGMRVTLSEGVILSTSATTHTSGSADTFFDMVMETSINLGDGIGLHAGYQEIRTAFDDTGLFEPLRESGLFARLTIKF